MKKSKVILAVVLAILLVITCVSVPTFSWFTRGHTNSGDNMMLDNESGFINNSFTAYNGYKSQKQSRTYAHYEKTVPILSENIKHIPQNFK